MAQNIVEQITRVGVVAIIRANSTNSLLNAAEAIRDGGMTVIEVTMTTPGALDLIREATTRLSKEIIFGAGTILDPETARLAILAGAQFIVAPILNLDTIALCKRYSIPIMPGAYTPTEIMTAWEAGADMVKVFPAETLGVKFIKAVKAPLPQVKLFPTGGVNVDNIGDFLRAGADAVGVGGELINQQLLDDHDFDALTARATHFREAVERARMGS